jgi:hypothetical protein
MILSVKICFYTYEEKKRNHAKFEFNFDGLGIWKRDPSGFRLFKDFMYLIEWFIYTFYESFYSHGQLDFPVFQLFQSAVSSSTKDMLIRTNKKLIVYNCLVN